MSVTHSAPHALAPSFAGKGRLVHGKSVGSSVIFKKSVDLKNQLLLDFLQSKWKVTGGNGTLCGRKNTDFHIKLPDSESSLHHFLNKTFYISHLI